MNTTEIDRYRGCLLGLAAGDALGTTLEFKRPGSFMPINDMVGGGPFRLEAGMWTDDTSMALCLAESLIERQEFDPEDQMLQYVRWYQEGHLSSNGYCFDIGNTTGEALERFIETGQAYAGATNAYSASITCQRLRTVMRSWNGGPAIWERFARSGSKAQDLTVPESHAFWPAGTTPSSRLIDPTGQFAVGRGRATPLMRRWRRVQCLRESPPRLPSLARAKSK